MAAAVAGTLTMSLPRSAVEAAGNRGAERADAAVARRA
jgi:hypothetical protein